MTAKVIQISDYRPKPKVEEEVEDDILSMEELERLNKEKEEKLLEERRKRNDQVAKTLKLKPKK